MPDAELPLLPLMVDDVPSALTQTLTQAGVPLRPRSVGGVDGRFVLFDSRCGVSQPPGYGQIAIDIDRLRRRFEDDPFESLCDEESQLQEWEIAGWTIRREIARVDRRAVRRRILDWLREEIEQAGGIWLCVSPFPYPFRSAFNLRIDHVRYDAVDFHATLRAIADCREATTHFLGGEAFESHADDLARLRGLDLGSRGYHDEIYSGEQANLENVRRGIEALRAAGLDPRGFAAPGGQFHRPLLSALQKLKISYSSECGLAYDDLPFFPEGSDVLQVPVHPIGLASFLSASKPNPPPPAVALQQAIHAGVDHFRNVARSKYHAGEPVFFRGDSRGSLGQYPQLLQTVVDTVDSFGALWKTTLGEFADWWRARAAVRLHVIREGDHYLVTSDSHPLDYHVGIECWRGRHVARMRLKNRVLRFSPGALAYENRTSPSLVHPVRIDPPEGIRGRMHRWIERGRTDPVDEASPDSWGHWAKRALRQLRG